MLTRRRLLESLVTTAGGIAFGPTGVGLVAGSPAAPQPPQVLPSRWLFQESSGRFWPVTDFHRWIDRHRAHPLLARAASGLATATDPDRRLRLVLRRCQLQCIEILPPAAGTTAAMVRIQHWRQDVGDLRPFFRALGLARPETRVQFLNRKRPALRLAHGDDFLFGRPLTGEPDLDELVARWQRRHEPGPLDWTAATTHVWFPCWPQLGGPGIPWAALETAWRITPPLPCPNCDEPTILAGFGKKRTSFLGFAPCREFVCPGCLRLHDAPLDGLDESVAALL